MKYNLSKTLFNFDINKIKNISVSKNEIYNQLILYIFSCTQNDILLVVSSLNEATELYNNLKKYIEDVIIFPEDDYMTKKAIAASPEFTFLRLNLLNEIKIKNKKIVIAHLNSFIKKLPNKKDIEENKIKLKTGNKIDRNQLIEKLIKIGYKKESIVTDTSEFSVRGFVIDIFPVHENNPIRIEMFDDTIESIKYFNTFSQLSTNNIEEISISGVIDDYGNNSSTIFDYMKDPITIYTNYQNIKNTYKMLEPQIKYLDIENEIYKLDELKKENDIFLNTLDNINCDLTINAKSITTSAKTPDVFLEEIKKNKGILYTTNKKIIKEVKEKYPEIKIKEENLLKGFIYEENYYYSDLDLNEQITKPSLNTGYKLGKKIDSLEKIQIGDYIVHKKCGIGIYQGIHVVEKAGMKQDYILLQYKGNDKLYIRVEDIDKLYKYTSKEGSKPSLNKLGGTEWAKTKLKIRQRIKDISEELLKIYKERNKATITPFLKDDENQIIFENEFEYEATPDQIKASEEIKRDLEKSKPMDRLLCGDVGYGKTEVIFRAVFKTIMNNKQVAYLCPTTVLSYQQYNSAKLRFKNYGINIDIINRHFTESQIKEKIKLLKEGKIDLIFGTHRLLSSDIDFKDLGLLIIDEEHKFGVEQKEKIKSLKSNVHVLSVSATPIPRSLQMSLVGLRDLSLIESAPKNRYPVQTYVIEENDMLIREAILKEKSRDGQSFILFNNIEKMPELIKKYQKLVPEAKFCYAHGAMDKNEMQDIIYDFTQKKYDCLISTTIIENGIDIPNANTIIVINADYLGLSSLYQIRGRVGRSDKIAYAYLMYKKDKLINSIAIKRLDAIKEFTELGSGYKISMRDLAIRGAGDILGKEQAGFIDSVGVDMYLELLNEEMHNINSEEEENYVKGIEVETHIDNKYSDESGIIIDLHKKINAITTRNDLEKVLKEIKDRFGIIDEKLKIYAYEKYLEKLLLITNLKINENNNLKTTILLNKKTYETLKIETLFIETTKISTKFNFKYSNNIITITLLKTSLEDNYITYLIKLLELIIKLKNEV